MVAWAQRPFFFSFFAVCHVCLCLEHTVRFWGSWRVFRMVLVPREHCACVESHVDPLRLCCAGVMVYKGELFPLWSRRSLDCAVIGRQRFSCVPVGWLLIPGSCLSIRLQTCDYVYIESKVHCLAGGLSSNASPPSCVLTQTYPLFNAEDSSDKHIQGFRCVCVCMWTVISLMKIISQVYINESEGS